MKRNLIFIMLLLIAVSCKKDPKKEEPVVEDESTEIAETSEFPEALGKIFEAHGGIDNWRKFKGLYYEIERSDYQEKYTVDLQDRRVRIEYKDHHLGYDGENVWVKDLNETEFKGEARFLYNLMYYFYTMPFIIGDEGINYGDAGTLTYEGKEYPSIYITYEQGTGESWNDEYIIYYNPDTFQMEWLAYTVTYFTKGKSQEYSLIKYHDWEEVNGLLMPSVLQWHLFEDGEVKMQINEMFFQNATFFEEIPADNNFSVPEGAEIIPEKEETSK